MARHPFDPHRVVLLADAAQMDAGRYLAGQRIEQSCGPATVVQQRIERAAAPADRRDFLPQAGGLVRRRFPLPRPLGQGAVVCLDGRYAAIEHIAADQHGRPGHAGCGAPAWQQRAGQPGKKGRKPRRQILQIRRPIPDPSRRQIAHRWRRQTPCQTRRAMPSPPPDSLPPHDASPLVDPARR